MGVDFRSLTEVIGMEGFDYAHYFRDERELLTPRMEEAGYSNIRWGKGETDSFGPLTRTCSADKDGHTFLFMYG